MAKSEIPGKVADYFNNYGDGTTAGAKIQEVFTPGVGWEPTKVALTMVGIRSLKKAGVTVIAVKVGDRIADFSVGEVIQYAERPVFGGKVI